MITQPQAGSFDAFAAVCTHQGCIVGWRAGAREDTGGLAEAAHPLRSAGGADRIEIAAAFRHGGGSGQPY